MAAKTTVTDKAVQTCVESQTLYCALDSNDVCACECWRLQYLNIRGQLCQYKGILQLSWVNRTCDVCVYVCVCVCTTQTDRQTVATTQHVRTDQSGLYTHSVCVCVCVCLSNAQQCCQMAIITKGCVILLTAIHWLHYHNILYMYMYNKRHFFEDMSILGASTKGRVWYHQVWWNDS